MAEESSKIKDLLAAVNASSGASNLDIKVDYASGSMLEGSLNELKKSAKLQVDYLGQLVGFQEQSLKDARLKSVQGENTENLQKTKGFGSELAGAGKAGLDAAFGAGGPFGALLGLLTSGLVSAAKMTYKMLKPTNARESADIKTEEKIAKEKIAAEEKAKFDAKKIQLETESKARMAEAEKLRVEADGKMARAKAEVLESSSGKPLKGAAEEAKRGKLFRDAELASREAAVAETAARDASLASKSLKPPVMPKGTGALAADVGETALRASTFGKVAAVGAGALSTTARVLLGPEALLAQLLLDPSDLADDTIDGVQRKELDKVVSMLSKRGVAAIPDVKKELEPWREQLENDAYQTDTSQALKWLLDANEQDISNFTASVMRSRKEGTFDASKMLNPKKQNFANRSGKPAEGPLGADRDRQNIDVRDRSLLTAPQTSSTPPIVIAPQNTTGPSSSTVNSHNTQNTTVIQKSDSSTVLQLGSQMPNGWTYDVPIM